MKKFEYIKTYKHTTDMELMNEMGKQGWELVCSYVKVSHGFGGTGEYYWKREIQNERI